MTNEREGKTLGQVCLQITDGKHGDCTNEPNSGYYFLSVKDIRDNVIDYSEGRQITQADFQDADVRTRFEIGDILLTNSGTIGRMAMPNNPVLTRKTTFQKSVAILKPDPKFVNRRFLFYYLKSKLANLIELAGGTAQKNLLLKDLRAFDLDLPDKGLQDKIAAVLSSIDDLVDNNSRRIELLDQIARLIYDEWFVKFKFPGHEKVEMVDSELGEIPEGWQLKKVSDIVINVKDSISADKLSLNLRYMPIDAIPRKSMLLREVAPLEEAQSSLILFKKGDIVFGSMRAYFHKVVLAPFDGVTRKTCFVLRSKAKYLWSFSYLTIYKDSAIEYASMHSHGATIPYAVWENGLADMKVVVPPPEVLERFEECVSPMLHIIIDTFFKNKNLKTTSDLLLPKLVSGEIDVSNLDISGS